MMVMMVAEIWTPPIYIYWRSIACETAHRVNPSAVEPPAGAIDPGCWQRRDRT